MRFLNPSLLIWLTVAAVPIALYFFRHKPRSQRVSTLLFFRSLAKEHQESAWLRKLKRLLSLLLTLLIIAAAAMALGRLVVSPPDDSVKSVVVLVDRSASMAARESGGRSRLDEALDDARRRVSALPGGVSVSVITYDARPDVLLSPSLDRRQALRALSAIAALPIEGDVEPAMRLANQLASLNTPAVVWHFTDAPAEAPTRQAASDGVQFAHLCTALAEPVNVGVTAFQLRPRPLERGRYDAFVQTHAQAGKPIDAEMQVRIDGTLVDLRKLTLEPGGRRRLMIPIEAGSGQVMAVTLTTDEPDALPADDMVLARVPAARPIRVLWVHPSPDAFTELALSSIGIGNQLHIYHGSPDAWPPKPDDDNQPDVVIFHDWLPEAWPSDYPVVVINPSRSLGPVQAATLERGGLPIDRLRAAGEHHPVLFGVASARVRLTQTVVLSGEGAGSGLEPLWIGPAGPVLQAGEVRGQRVVVMGFSPPASEHLPLMASYPLLLGNAVFWASIDATKKLDSRTSKTGSLVVLTGREVTWTYEDNDGMTEKTLRVRSKLTALDRVGLWRTDTQQAGGAALLSVHETLLPSSDDKGSAADAVADGWLGGDLTAALLSLVLAILVIESWLFHRHAVY